MKSKKSQKVSFDKVKEPYKTREAQMVALWLSMPFVMHGMDSKKLKGLGYDVEDSDFTKVVACSTRTELAAVLKMTREQIHRWEVTDWMAKRVAELNLQSNVMRFKKDIDYNFTQRTLRQGNAAEVKLWKQLYEGWIERSRNEDPGLAQAIRDKADAIRALANKK